MRCMLPCGHLFNLQFTFFFFSAINIYYCYASGTLTLDSENAVAKASVNEHWRGRADRYVCEKTVSLLSEPWEHCDSCTPGALSYVI